MAKKKHEEVYRLTFKGFINLYFEFDNEATSKFLDTLELWLRRVNENAIILTKPGEFTTQKLYLEEK